MRKHFSFLIFLCLFISLNASAQWKGKPVDFSHGSLKVSDNKRFLVHEDGTPFFYLGDTAWEIFHRLDREDVDKYLQDRASKGYTVIQAVALAEFDGLTVPNAYGHLPLIDKDPARPDVKEGPDNDYWDHVDYVVDKANSLGMYVAILPTWGRYFHDDNNIIFTPENAELYGEFIGNRYKDKQVIWVLGGDRPANTDFRFNVIKALAKGIKKVDNGKHLITYHPPGLHGSSEWFQNEPWIDFNMRQNGHETEYTASYFQTFNDYNKTPIKPVMDGEPAYEDHPVSFKANKHGHTISSDVRAALYWDLFNGAFGHTYGHHSVWQMYDPEKGRKPINNPLMPWQEAIQQPAAGQMMYGRLLIESRPFLTRIPDPSIIVTSSVPTAMPGEGRYRFAATRDTDGTYMMIYAPVGRKFTVNMKLLKGDKVNGWWFNPRNGKATKIGTFDNNMSERTFISPDKGEMIDWILVLDDASCKYPAPGKPLK